MPDEDVLNAIARGVKPGEFDAAEQEREQEKAQEKQGDQPPLAEALTLAQMMVKDEEEIPVPLKMGRVGYIRNVDPREVAISPFFQLGIDVKEEDPKKRNKKLNKYLQKNAKAYEDFLICLFSSNPKIVPDEEEDLPNNKMGISKLKPGSWNRNSYLSQITQTYGQACANFPF